MKWIYLICLLIFSIFLTTTIHEFIHIIQHKGQVQEVCFVGYSDGAAGWVTPKNEEEMEGYFKPDKFSLSNLYHYTFQKEEIAPIFISFAVFALFLWGVAKTQIKEEREQCQHLNL